MEHFNFDKMMTEMTRLEAPMLKGPLSFMKWGRKSSLVDGSGLSPRRTTVLNIPELSDSINNVKTPLAARTPRARSPGKLGGILHQRSLHKTPSKTPNKGCQDRFIPNRTTTDFEMASHAIRITVTDVDAEETDLKKAEFSKQLGEAMSIPADVKILSYKENKPKPAEGYANNLQVIYSKNVTGASSHTTRLIPHVPERILDAPYLMDDYYLNLLDWSSLNRICVALSTSVYIWDASTGAIVQLLSLAEPGHYVSSVKWIEQGDILAVGMSAGPVELWDTTAQKRIRNMTGHAARVGSLSWNAHTLSSGARTGTIHHHDVRVAEHKVGVLAGHSQDICGLAWSPDGKHLASGGNDNILNIWTNSLGTGVEPLLTLTHHQAAVKALSWCPWQHNLLASGGGTADRQIRLWNVSTGSNLSVVDTKSQVCSILWSKEYKELISGHGYSYNQLSIWKYPDLTKVTDLEGHKARVLNLSMSPDGAMVASAAADETIRIWNCFAVNKKKSLRAKSGSEMDCTLLMKAANIR